MQYQQWDYTIKSENKAPHKLHGKRRRYYRNQLTCENGWHHGSEHEEQHAEEQTSGIVEHLSCLIADFVVEQANQEPNQDV